MFHNPVQRGDGHLDLSDMLVEQHADVARCDAVAQRDGVDREIAVGKVPDNVGLDCPQPPGGNAAGSQR